MNGVDILWSQIDKGRRGENIGISTGIPKLDKVIGGVQPQRKINGLVLCRGIWYLSNAWWYNVIPNSA